MSPGIAQKRKPPTREQKRIYNARYRASAKGKAATKRWRQANPDYFRARKAAVIAKKICPDCQSTPARPGMLRCKRCQDKQLAREQVQRASSGRPWRQSQKERDRIAEMQELSEIALSQRLRFTTIDLNEEAGERRGR